MKKYINYKDLQRCREPPKAKEIQVQTAELGDCSNKAASTEFVQRAIETYILSMPPASYKLEE